MPVPPPDRQLIYLNLTSYLAGVADDCRCTHLTVSGQTAMGIRHHQYIVAHLGKPRLEAVPRLVVLMLTDGGAVANDSDTLLALKLEVLRLSSHYSI